jgi:hypothetical protein
MTQQSESIGIELQIHYCHGVTNWLRRLFSKPFACGHVGENFDAVTAYGETIEFKEEMLKEREMCGPCLEQHLKTVSARCVGCGRLILSGQIIALTCIQPEDPDYARVVKKEGRSGNVVTCTRPSCSSGDFSGRWVEPTDKNAIRAGVLSSIDGELHPTISLGEYRASTPIQAPVSLQN